MMLDQNVMIRLAFLLRVVKKQASHLAITDSRIFSSPFTVLLAEQLVTDVDLAERLDAFVFCFRRLQDTLGDKLLPLLLKLLGEGQGAFVDNPSRTVGVETVFINIILLGQIA